jgi:hypothetical protein
MFFLLWFAKLREDRNGNILERRVGSHNAQRDIVIE